MRNIIDEQNPIYKSISDWYFENFENWKLEVSQIPSSVISYELILRNGINKPINIVNTGSGISQSFPLILRSFMPVEEPTLIIIEEPETHLHPAAHGNLAERFLISFLENNNRNYLIETHSENFILRLQSIIADPEIAFTSNDIKIYYVDFVKEEQSSKLVSLDISEDGEIEDWPDNVFNENLDEVYKLRRNQKSVKIMQIKVKEDCFYKSERYIDLDAIFSLIKERQHAWIDIDLEEFVKNSMVSRIRKT